MTIAGITPENINTILFATTPNTRVLFVSFNAHKIPIKGTIIVNKISTKSGKSFSETKIDVR